jgi:hypothetical protein
MKQAVGLHWDNGAMNPGRVPWAGMRQAVGLKATASPPQARIGQQGRGYMKKYILPIHKRRPNPALSRRLKKFVLRPGGIQLTPLPI